jgi:hypothetical protein
MAVADHPKRRLWQMRTHLLAFPVVALAALVAWCGPAHAYGRADSPLAQIEFSGNCDNPSFGFCAPPPAGVGIGGIWLWVEIDADGTGDLSGAVCGHTFGTGPSGAQSIKGGAHWTYSTRADGMGQGAFGFPGIIDPHDRYYLVTIPTGEKLLFPTTVAHYSFAPVHGVSLQLQVAR